MGDYLYPFQKKHYIKNRDRGCECILCECLRKNSKVTSLLICRSILSAVCVNLYPYNPGHLMIFPIRHITDLRDLSDSENQDITTLTSDFLNIMEEIYTPSGFNIGFNMGDSSGASIPHIHRHIIPRYANELGIVELIGGAKVLIEDPKDTLLEYIEHSKKYKFITKNITF